MPARPAFTTCDHSYQTHEVVTGGFGDSPVMPDLTGTSSLDPRSSKPARPALDRVAPAAAQKSKLAQGLLLLIVPRLVTIRPIDWVPVRTNALAPWTVLRTMKL